MQKLAIHSFIVFVLLSGIFSCKKKDEPTPTTPPHSHDTDNKVELPFLKEGTEYSFVYSDLFFEDTMKTVIEKEIAKDTFLVRTYTDVSYMNPSFYLVYKDNNLYSSFRLRDPDTYYILCKFGQPVGTSWTVNQTNTTSTYTIDAINDTVIAGTGKVTDAVRVKIVTTGSSSIQYAYISPTVGILGAGDFGSDAPLQLLNYKIGTATNTPAASYPPTFGSFPFMSVGKNWRYKQQTAFSDEADTIKIEIVSKLADKNIYRVKLTYEYDNSSEYEYWFEDHGMLMVYEEGETYLQADPIYMKDTEAKTGYGWIGRTSSGTIFYYKIMSLNENTDSYFGVVPCMGIDVSNGPFSSQTNYWNKDKGQVYVDGLMTMEVIESNARKAKIPYIPCFTF